LSSLVELKGSRDLMVNLTLRELRGKYKRSILGWTWSLLNPLASMVIFTVVFSLFLKVSVPPGRPSGLTGFAFFLMPALLAWNFLSNGMNGSMGALLGNSNLIKKVYFPREVLVGANIASWVVALLIEMFVLAIAVLIAGSMVLPWLLPLLLIIAIQTVFVLGVGLILSVLNVFFRDVQHLINIVLQLWFYATPIVYPITVVPENANILGVTVPVRTLYGLNPMVRFVDAYRAVLYDLRFPALDDMLFITVAAIVALVVGVATFNRLEPKLAEEL
jgi:ABC-2 type transport system permease protein